MIRRCTRHGFSPRHGAEVELARSLSLALVIVSAGLWPGATEGLDGSAFGPNVLENRDRLATAMTGQIVGDSDKRFPFAATFADVNLDGYWELLARSNSCGNCPPLLLALQEGRYADLVALSGLTLTTGALAQLDEVTRGYRDLRAGDTLLAWNGERYADASTRSRPLDRERYVAACAARNEYSYYVGDPDAEGARASEAMCSCIADRIAEMGFGQAELDAEAAASNPAGSMGKGQEQASAGSLAAELPLIVSSCAIREGFAKSLPVAPQMYASWTENYGNLILNPYFEGDPTEPENPLTYSRFVKACAESEDVVGSARIGTVGRAVSVCGCVAERLSMAGAVQEHLDAAAGLYDLSLGEDEVNRIEQGLVDFIDQQGSWCARRLQALIDHKWPEEAPE